MTANCSLMICDKRPHFELLSHLLKTIGFFGKAKVETEVAFDGPPKHKLHSGNVTRLTFDDWSNNLDPQNEYFAHVQKHIQLYRDARPLRLTATSPFAFAYGPSFYETPFSDRLLSQIVPLPSYEKLILDFYDWRHTATFAQSYFNWSRITHLELRDVSIMNFLQSIRPENLTTLQTFITDGWEVNYGDPEEQMAAKKILHSLFSHIKCLRRVAFRAYVSTKASILALAKYADTLYELDLRHYSQTWIVELQWPGAGLGYISMIASNLPKVTDLTVELHKVWWCDEVERFCSVLCHCRNLRRLTIFGPPLSKKDIAYDTTQFEYFATQLVMRLWESKHGATFEEIGYRREAEWYATRLRLQWNGVLRSDGIPQMEIDGPHE